MTQSWGGVRGGVGNKKPPVVRAAICIFLEFYFTLSGAILNTNKSLIIRTTIRTTIRERLKIGFIRF